MQTNKVPINLALKATSLEAEQIKEQRLLNKLIKRFMKVQKRFIYDKHIVCVIS